MANNRKASRILELKGTFRGDRQNKIDLKNKPPRRPLPPKTLSVGARREWDWLAPKAYEIGTLTDPDIRSFELLCETLATERQARAIVGKDGMTIQGGTGPKANPAIKAMETARAQATRLLESFGLTPKSRTGVDLKSYCQIWCLA